MLAKLLGFKRPLTFTEMLEKHYQDVVEMIKKDKKADWVRRNQGIMADDARDAQARLNRFRGAYNQANMQAFERQLWHLLQRTLRLRM